MILALETSCDETAAACVTGDGRVLSNVVVVPGGPSRALRRRRPRGRLAAAPRACRARSSREALDEAEASLDDVELVAVTRGPGLIGALLVGVSAAKALAWSRRLPLAPVDHLHAHVASLFVGPPELRLGMERSRAGLPLEPPFLCLLASGGHTLLLDVADHGRYRMLGTTLDDAAGEAFDKGARLLGLGYPGRGGDRPRGPERRPRGLRVPGRPRAGARFLLLGREDGPAVRGP